MNELIKSLREKNNYSQAKVAAYLGISRQMYIKYENGSTEPPVSVLRSLSELYKVPVSDFLNDSHLNKNIEYRIKKQEPIVLNDIGSSRNITSLNYRHILSLLYKLSSDEVLSLIEECIKCVKKKNEEKLQPMTMEKKMELFHKFKGYIKDRKIEDPKQEYLNYLDERYGK